MDLRNTGIPFGVRLRCGNFYIQKFSRGLSKNELYALRKDLVLPKGTRLPSVRGTLPFIRMATISGSWRMEWACTMRMFSILDSLEVVDGALSPSALVELNGLISMLYTETTVLGDDDFLRDRVKAMNDYLLRISKNLSPSPDDGKIIEDEEVKFRTMQNLEGVEDEE